MSEDSTIEVALRCVNKTSTVTEHVTDGSPCWCHPMSVCGECGAVGPCVHGGSRKLVVIHNEARN